MVVPGKHSIKHVEGVTVRSELTWAVDMGTYDSLPKDDPQKEPDEEMQRAAKRLAAQFRTTILCFSWLLGCLISVLGLASSGAPFTFLSDEHDCLFLCTTVSPGILS
eukprot:scaffold1558_cov403-Prasinococcus_capsulatus_cf.AAC.42